jgi:PilZ domain-containing protein
MTHERFGPDGLDRRRSLRVSLAELEGAVSVVGAKLVNVNHHGMLIDSPVPLELEATARLRLVIRGQKIDVEARVAGCTLTASGPRPRFGVGFEFLDMPEEARDRLHKTLALLTERRRSA